MKNGAVFTKRWVVDLILDLVGYHADERLFEGLMVEPASGDGSFLAPIVERLVRSCELHCVPVTDCQKSIIAFELDPKSTDAARHALVEVLTKLEVSVGNAELLADSWVRCGDYLLETASLSGAADWVVGNPPYIRLEDLENRGREYRASYPTMVGRADIYVAFFEAALRHLKHGGTLGFICADRWKGLRMMAEPGGAFASLIGFSTDVTTKSTGTGRMDVATYSASSIPSPPAISTSVTIKRMPSVVENCCIASFVFEAMTGVRPMLATKSVSSERT